MLWKRKESLSFCVGIKFVILWGIHNVMYVMCMPLCAAYECDAAGIHLSVFEAVL